MDKTEQYIESLFLPLPTHLAELVKQLREFFKKETRPTREIVFSSYNSINIGYGFTEKAWDCYCGIITYKKHVNISFPSGAALKDPEHLLQGTGSRVRHVRIDKVDDIKRPAMIDLIKQARDRAWDLSGESSSSANTLKTLVKPGSTKKK